MVCGDTTDAEDLVPEALFKALSRLRRRGDAEAVHQLDGTRLSDHPKA